jgi:hypothetical protein
MGRGQATLMGEMRNAYNILVEKPDVKRQLGRPRHRCEGRAAYVSVRQHV